MLLARGRLKTKSPNSRALRLTSTLNYLSLGCTPLLVPLGCSMSLNRWLSPPRNFDELRALGDSIASTSLHPQESQNRQGESSESSWMLGHAPEISPLERRLSFPQLLEGLAAEGSQLRLFPGTTLA